MKLNVLSSAAYDRELEIFSYEANIATYDNLLVNELPTGEWDSSVIAYKGSNIEDVPEALADLFVQYTFRDKIENLKKTEVAERAKTQYVYTQIINQILAAGGDPYTLIPAIATARNA
jgi:hypothetical protein